MKQHLDVRRFSSDHPNFVDDFWRFADSDVKKAIALTIFEL